jgi:hypothetical protein
LNISFCTHQDEIVLKKAEELSKVVLAKVLDDRGTMALSQDFINRLAQSETTKRLLMQVLYDPANQRTLQQFAQELTWRVLVDERTSLLCGELVVKVMARDDVRAAATQLAAAVVRNDETRDAAATLARAVLASSDVRHDAGDALYDAAKHALLPSFLRASDRSPDVDANVNDEQSSSVATAAIATPPTADVDVASVAPSSSLNDTDDNQPKPPVSSSPELRSTDDSPPTNPSSIQKTSSKNKIENKQHIVL